MNISYIEAVLRNGEETLKFVEGGTGRHMDEKTFFMLVEQRKSRGIPSIVHVYSDNGSYEKLCAFSRRIESRLKKLLPELEKRRKLKL